MKSILSSAAVLGIVSLLTSACGFDRSSTVLGPTSTTSNSPNPGSSTAAAPGPLVGTWASNAVATPTSLTSCGNFQYVVTTQTATTIAGTFTGACGGGVTITGNATGQISGTNVAITVTGNANVPGTS